MNSFDKSIKERIEKEAWMLPPSIDNKINNVLKNLPKVRTKRTMPFKMAISVAIISCLTISTVFAMDSPRVASAVKNLLSYFGEKDSKSNSGFKYEADKEVLEEFNSTVGITSEDQGIKFTLDNLAADDNFLNLFLTVESEKPIPKIDNPVFAAFAATPLLNFKIDGKELGLRNNNNMEAYFENDNKLKVMIRENILGTDVGLYSELEIFTTNIFKTKGNWSISTTIDKSKIVKDIKTVTPNANRVINVDNKTYDITVNKVSISPLGNQILLTEITKEGEGMFPGFALFDDKGNSLHVLNTDGVGVVGKATNGYEFLGANKDTKSLTLVPVKVRKGVPMKILKGDVTTLPATLKASEGSTIVIDNLECIENKVKITYHYEGYVEDGCDFMFYDKDGNEVHGGKGAITKSVDRNTGRYTQTITSYNKDMRFSGIAKIETCVDGEVELLYDQQIKIDLE